MVPAVNLLGKKAEMGQVSGRSRTEGQGYQTCYKIQGKSQLEVGLYCQLQS